jgi:hypothetical protein
VCKRQQVMVLVKVVVLVEVVVENGRKGCVQACVVGCGVMGCRVLTRATKESEEK